MSETFITNTDTGEGESEKERKKEEDAKTDENDTNKVNVEQVAQTGFVYQPGKLNGKEIHDESEVYRMDNSEGDDDNLFINGLVIDGKHKNLHHRKEHSSDAWKVGTDVVHNSNVQSAGFGQLENDTNTEFEKDADNEVTGTIKNANEEKKTNETEIESKETDSVNIDNNDAKPRDAKDKSIHRTRKEESSMISYESGGLPPKNTPAQSVYGSEPDGRVQQMYVRFPGQRHGLMML